MHLKNRRFSLHIDASAISNVISRRNIPGSAITLEPIGEQHISDTYVSWFNDPDVTRYNSHGRELMTLEKIESYVRGMAQSETDAVFAIIVNDKRIHVGNISLLRIDPVHKSADYAIILGEKEYWGTGIAKEASQLLLRYGFEELGLHRIACGTSAANIPMQKLAARLGFVQEGVRKEAFYKNGEFLDVIEYGLLCQDHLV